MLHAVKRGRCIDIPKYDTRVRACNANTSRSSSVSNTPTPLAFTTTSASRASASAAAHRRHRRLYRPHCAHTLVQGYHGAAAARKHPAHRIMACPRACSARSNPR